MAHSIPPLNPLRVFECTARHGSFTKAAEELYVSQSAVSRQVSTLEDYLQIKLFIREQSGVRLTLAGEKYQQEIGPAFASIASATKRLRVATAESPLKLLVYPTFAVKWLMPRLPSFEKKYPDIQVRINTSVPPVDFVKDDVDGAIQLGNGTWSGADAEHLFDDEIEPVCSPRLLEETHLSEPEGLLHQRLLFSRYRRTDWEDWSAGVDLSLPEKPSTMVFPSSLLTYQAAMEGLGVAIGQSKLLQTEFDRRVLVRPFSRPVQRGLAYYLITPKGLDLPYKLRVFRDWLADATIRATDCQPERDK